MEQMGIFGDQTQERTSEKISANTLRYYFNQHQALKVKSIVDLDSQKTASSLIADLLKTIHREYAELSVEGNSKKFSELTEEDILNALSTDNIDIGSSKDLRKHGKGKERLKKLLNNLKDTDSLTFNSLLKIIYDSEAFQEGSDLKKVLKSFILDNIYVKLNSDVRLNSKYVSRWKEINRKVYCNFSHLVTNFEPNNFILLVLLELKALEKTDEITKRLSSDEKLYLNHTVPQLMKFLSTSELASTYILGDIAVWREQPNPTMRADLVPFSIPIKFVPRPQNENNTQELAAIPVKVPKTATHTKDTINVSKFIFIDKLENKINEIEKEKRLLNLFKIIMQELGISFTYSGKTVTANNLTWEMVNNKANLTLKSCGFFTSKATAQKAVTLINSKITADELIKGLKDLNLLEKIIDAVLPLFYMQIDQPPVYQLYAPWPAEHLQKNLEFYLAKNKDGEVIKSDSKAEVEDKEEIKLDNDSKAEVEEEKSTNSSILEEGTIIHSGIEYGEAVYLNCYQAYVIREMSKKNLVNKICDSVAPSKDSKKAMTHS